MKNLIPLTVAVVCLTGCTNNAAKFAKEMAKNPATISFSMKQNNAWTGTTEISFARSGTNNPANAEGGKASVNGK